MKKVVLIFILFYALIMGELPRKLEKRIEYITHNSYTKKTIKYWNELNRFDEFQLNKKMLLINILKSAIDDSIKSLAQESLIKDLDNLTDSEIFEISSYHKMYQKRITEFYLNKYGVYKTINANSSNRKRLNFVDELLNERIAKLTQNELTYFINNCDDKHVPHLIETYSQRYGVHSLNLYQNREYLYTKIFESNFSEWSIDNLVTFLDYINRNCQQETRKAINKLCLLRLSSDDILLLSIKSQKEELQDYFLSNIDLEEIQTANDSILSVIFKRKRNDNSFFKKIYKHVNKSILIEYVKNEQTNYQLQHLGIIHLINNGTLTTEELLTVNVINPYKKYNRLFRRADSIYIAINGIIAKEDLKNQFKLATKAQCPNIQQIAQINLIEKYPHRMSKEEFFSFISSPNFHVSESAASYYYSLVSKSLIMDHIFHGNDKRVSTLLSNELFRHGVKTLSIDEMRKIIKIVGYSMDHSDALIRNGNKKHIPFMVELINNNYSRNAAESYYNCGNETLKEAAISASLKRGLRFNQKNRYSNHYLSGVKWRNW